MPIRPMAALAITITVLVLCLAWTLYHPPFYLGEGHYAPEDAILAQWLKQNGDLSRYVIVNANTHNTATWVQALSGGPHFLYKVDFAVSVSPPPYAQVYADLKALYDHPGSPEVPMLLSKYNVGYVLVDLVDQQAFRDSPFLRQVFSVARTAIFVPAASANSYPSLLAA